MEPFRRALKRLVRLGETEPQDGTAAGFVDEW
jgi:hypothetical protein